MNILYAITGSVAAILAPKLCQRLQTIGDVATIATPSALHFLPPREEFPVHVDAEEWEWKKVGDPIMHIELRKWADVLVVAPMTANTMAKFALGLADNLVTNTFRAWDTQKPTVLAPAMNTWMWDNARRVEHNRILREQFALVVPPQYKCLACGDEGVGAMADIETIVDTVKNSKKLFADL